MRGGCEHRRFGPIFASLPRERDALACPCPSPQPSPLGVKNAAGRGGAHSPRVGCGGRSGSDAGASGLGLGGWVEGVAGAQGGGLVGAAKGCERVRRHPRGVPPALWVIGSERCFLRRESGCAY